MSVTVEVRGVSAGGSGTPSIGGGTTSPGQATGAFTPTDERMIADIRREMQSRGVILVPGSQGLQQILGQYKQQMGESVRADVAQRYQVRRDELKRRASEGYSKIDRELESDPGLRERLSSKDPLTRKVAQDELEAARNNRYRRFGTEISKEQEKLEAEEQSEKSRAENDLTDAIKRLTEYFERESESGASSDSYIGRLRAEQKALIAERDAATDEEGAMSASRRLADVNLRMRRAMTGELGRDTANQWGLVNMMSGFERAFSAADSGDLAGMISGAGGAGIGMAAAMGKMSLATAAKFMGIIGLIASAGGAVQKAGARHDELSGLAAFRGTISDSRSGELVDSKALKYEGKTIAATLRDSRLSGYRGVGIEELGMNEKEFANEVDKRIRARGMSDDWFNETFRQIAIERNYALREGSLMNAGTYDRYGITGTEAVVRLVNMLTGIKGSGVSAQDFTRIQEKLDIQQQIMSSYMGRVDRPDYNVANRAVAAMSAVNGITQDSRIGADYASFQQALQNPMNDRMKALIYGAVEDIIPETRGRMDKIDFALRSDENEGKILQAVIQRINTMYGGMDTQMGYFAFRNIFPGIAPDRLKRYIEDFSNPESEASQILMGSLRGASAEVDQFGRKKVDVVAVQQEQLVSGISETLIDIGQGVRSIVDFMTGQSNNGVDAGRNNGVRSGGN